MPLPFMPSPEVSVGEGARPSRTAQRHRRDGGLTGFGRSPICDAAVTRCPLAVEIWDRTGLARTMLEAAAVLRGQLIYVNGREQARIDLVPPPEVHDPCPTG